MFQKEINILDDPAAMAAYLTGRFGERMAAGKEEASLRIALSGGSTPGRIFRELVQPPGPAPFWRRVRFYQADERCVPPGHPDSNYAMIRSHLPGELQIPEAHFFRMKGEEEPEAEAERYGQLLAETLPMEEGWPVFDAVLLGLGDDGHTASLFPGDDRPPREGEYCTTAVHPLSGQRRLTLTLPVIKHDRQVILLVLGREKARIVFEVLCHPENYDYPAARVKPVRGALTWLLDREAASLLPPGAPFTC